MKKLLKTLEVLSFIMGVFGIYLYYESVKEREPTFITNPYSLNILDKELVKNSPLKVMTNDGLEIKNNVYATTFYFFNKGGESIKKENILSPIQVAFSDTSTQIIDFKVLSISRPITEIKVVADSLNRNHLNIDFKILERNDGISVQVISISNNDPILEISGIIEGSGSKFSNDYGDGFKKFLRKYIFLTIGCVGLIVLLIMFGSFRIFVPNYRFQLFRTQNITIFDNVGEKATLPFTYFKVIIYSTIFMTLIFAIAYFLLNKISGIQIRDIPKTEITIPESLK